MKRTVLTTGANSGIGLSTAIELAKAGFRSVGSARSEAKAERLHEAARDAGVEVESVIFDVTDAAGCERVIDELRPWAVINNAGYAVNGAVEDVDDDEARRAFETMVFAPMRLSRLALPHMRASGSGRIVNISSIYGLTTSPLMGWYQAAKHALEGLSDALRKEVASSGIDVVLIEPGGFRTGIWEEAKATAERRAGSRYDAAYQRSLDSMEYWLPMMGEPVDVARVISGALKAGSPSARYIVGNDARVLNAADSVLPTFAKDWLERTFLGL